MNELIFDLQAEMAELAAIEAESIGWLPLCAPDPRAAAGGGGGGAGGCFRPSTDPRSADYPAKKLSLSV